MTGGKLIKNRTKSFAELPWIVAYLRQQIQISILDFEACCLLREAVRRMTLTCVKRGNHKTSSRENGATFLKKLWLLSNGQLVLIPVRQSLSLLGCRPEVHTKSWRWHIAAPGPAWPMCALWGVQNFQNEFCRVLLARPRTWMSESQDCRNVLTFSARPDQAPPGQQAMA